MNAATDFLSPARLGQLVLGKERLPNGREVPSYKINPFVKFINRDLVDLLSGQISRLGVFGPPRHGKTTILSVLLPVVFLGLNPTKQVILASHSATLASKFSGQVRDILVEFGPTLFGVQVREDRRAIDNWALTTGGGMLSIGVGGSLVGHGADLFIFDDIIADAAAALSETVRRNTLDWYQSTAETRVNSGGLQVFTMQRWHAEDPAQKVVYDDPDRWRIRTIRAIAEDDDILGRKEGEALWPEEYPIETLREFEARKTFWFAAQYQQRPVPRGGGMIQGEWIENNQVKGIPTTGSTRVRWWDRAATDGGGDFTAGARLSNVGAHVYIEDVQLGQWGSGRRDKNIREVCERDNREFPNAITTWSEQEPGSSGKDMALAFSQMLRPFSAKCEVSSGSKLVRADGLAGAFSRGEIHVCLNSDGAKPPWFGALYEQLTTFPFGKNDDIVDSLSGAYNKLTLGVGDREATLYTEGEDPALDAYAALAVCQ